MNKQDAWKAVIDGLGIDLEAALSAIIPASSFQEYARTEARLAAKMDCSRDVPPLLRDRGLFPLPITNGEYRLVRGKGFHELERIGDPVQSFQSRLDFDLCTLRGQSESMFVHYAYNSGLISHFTGKNGIVKGHESRQYAKKFSFNVGKVGPIDQEGSQIQIDGLFEGPDSVIVMEAKTRKSEDFIIRQLYYPMRHWRSETEREVFAIFLHIDPLTKIYTFRQYAFSDNNDYSSIQLTKGARYTIDERPRQPAELEGVTPESDLGYVPQADSVDKILNLPFLVAQGINTAESIARTMGFRGRQGNYYSEAVEALGLIERQRKNGAEYRLDLTDIGKCLVSARPDKRADLLARQMMRLPVMKAIFDELVEMTALTAEATAGLSRGDVTRIIRENSRYSGSTPGRRASSVISWFRWLSENYGLFQIRDGSLCLHRHSHPDIGPGDNSPASATPPSQ